MPRRRGSQPPAPAAVPAPEADERTGAVAGGSGPGGGAAAPSVEAAPLEPEVLDGPDEGDGLDLEEPDPAELAAAEPVGVDLPPLAGADEEHEEHEEHNARDLPSAPRRSAPGARSLVRHDPLQAYVQEIRRYPLLTREEEHVLAVRFTKRGDLDAARALVTANLRLVVKIAHEYQRAYKNLLDLIQEGNIGLMQAVKKYDPYRGVKFSSYAAWWIRAYVLKFILNNWRLVKIGTTQAQRKLFFNLRKEKERLEVLGFEVEPKLLAERLDVTEQEVREMEQRLGSPEVSLDAPLKSDEAEGRTFMDVMPSAERTRPDAQFEGTEFSALLRQKLAAFGTTLEGREATIFQERLLSDPPLTLQEIGERYGISRERARQLEKRLLERVRTYLKRELGDTVDIVLGRED
jgi:RNA polymerase sigma-32 factor